MAGEINSKPNQVIDVISDSLKSHASSLSEKTACVVAFSGGIDSVVLLHTLSLLQKKLALPPIHAVHVHHGLSPNADHWATHCRAIASHLNVHFHCAKVSVLQAPRVSLEAAAREARYDALVTYCEQHQGALFLGHHQDDQVETVLLQLKRGAGPKGLSGMKMQSMRGSIPLLRLMLSLSREEIEAYADCHQLEWVEDESNNDNAFDRNFLRNQILPLLNQRWPSFAQTVSRSAALCEQQESLLSDVINEKLVPLVHDDKTLAISELAKYDSRWQRQLLRGWLTQLNSPLMSEAQLNEALTLTSAKEDSQPVLNFSGWQIRRFDGRLYASVKETFATNPVTQLTDTQWRLPAWGYQLSTSIRGVELTSLPLSTKVKPFGEQVSKPLKQWFKHWRIAPWQRANCPLIVKDDQVLAIALPSGVKSIANTLDVGESAWVITKEDGS